MLNELQNWVPWRVTPELNCRWLYVGNKSFTEPFFEDTVGVCRSFEENSSKYKPVSSLEMMFDWARQLNDTPPTALIFHVSRCGSTLVSQLLACSDNNIVLSEVPFLDDLLRLPLKRGGPGIDMTDKYFLAAIKLYGREQFNRKQNLFIKTDSWHLHFYEQLRALFPTTIFILLYRDPFEVIRSHQRQRGLQSVPGLIEPQIFGFNNSESTETNLDSYVTGVLESFFRKMISINEMDPYAFAFNYSDGIANITRQIYALLNLPISSVLEKGWEDRCRFHAKRPKQLFAEESGENEILANLQTVLQLYHEMESSARTKRHLAERIIQ